MTKSRIINRVASKVWEDELKNSRALGFSYRETQFSAFAALQGVVEIAMGPTPIEVWPRFTTIDTSTE